VQQCKLLIPFRTGNGVVVTRYRQFIIVIYYRSAQDRIRSFEQTDEMCIVVNTSLLYYYIDSLTVETAKRVMFCGSCGRHSIQLYTSTKRNSLKLNFIWSLYSIIYGRRWRVKIFFKGERVPLKHFLNYSHTTTHVIRKKIYTFLH